jgi:MarR family 2-MHQ and catechol resistance regulon transcriptional repressor
MNETEEAKKTQREEISVEIRDVQRLFSKVMLEVIGKQNNITDQQWAVLKIISKKPMQMNELGHELVVSSPTITSLIDRMEKKGLVKREDCKDRRKIEIQLTPEGKKFYEKAKEQITEFLQKSVSALTPQETTELLLLLKKLKNAISQEGIREAAINRSNT